VTVTRMAGMQPNCRPPFGLGLGAEVIPRPHGAARPPTSLEMS
jgi:hypothetical protein